MARIKTLAKRDCDGESCSIIKGQVLTMNGYRDIEDLRDGDLILNEKGRAHVLKGIKESFLLDKPAVKVGNTIVTADMMFLLDEKAYGTFDTEGCYKAVFNDVRTSTVLGHFDRRGLPLYDINLIVTYTNGHYLTSSPVDLPMSTKIYTLIVDGARWCVVDDMIMACAKEIRGFRVKED